MACCRPRVASPPRSILDGRVALMNFEQNLFISYAHIDNQPLTRGARAGSAGSMCAEGAVEHAPGPRGEDLARRKTARQRLSSDEIVAQFKESAVLVSIVIVALSQIGMVHARGPRILRDAEQNGGLTVGNKSRVFKVMKTPVENLEALPAPIKDVLGYEFFTSRTARRWSSIRPMGRSSRSSTI